ncbi:hypothetical protein G4B88_010940 [Cannabis sativa]|uniref:Transcription factor MYC/MYB N-terminal domain-containing protein n=1 Tax=Cannabis sativa TaxID=3483 RepID=A0A7J6HJS1_CANSA|nr:hypothetical protein G4B88_010940 [Cannabis sativa]
MDQGEQLSQLAVTHLLQHTLRSLCIHENSQWVYAVFWRILPRNYPPPNLIGKVAADHSHKWIYKEPNDQEINFLSAWHNSADSYPRTWEAQFQSGIKVIEDLSYVVLLRKKLSYIESIPGVLLPHPSSPSSSSSSPYNHNYGITPDNNNNNAWPNNNNYNLLPQSTHHQSYYDHHHHHHQSYYNQLPLMKNNNNNNNMITPSMSSLEALLSKLPSVVPPPAPPHMAAHSAGCFSNDLLQRSTNLEFVAKNEVDHDDNNNNNNNDQDQQQYHFHHHNNLYSQK